MTLSDIRAAQDEETLKQAVKDVVQNWHRLTHGETSAMLSVIRERAAKIGVSIEALNKYADECAS